MSLLADLITSSNPSVRNQSLDRQVEGWPFDLLLSETRSLDAFRRTAENLYDRVRALAFLAALHRYHIPRRLVAAQGAAMPAGARGGEALIPFRGYEQLLERRFEEAIDTFLACEDRDGPSDAISSALTTAYHRLTFQTLADQVRRSVRSVRGNQWMFRMGHPADQPLRIRPELLVRGPSGAYPWCT